MQKQKYNHLKEENLSVLQKAEKRKKNNMLNGKHKIRLNNKFITECNYNNVNRLN